MDSNSESLVYPMFGFAGTGKSTIANELVRGRSRRWLFGAYTGKAAHVMRQKGCEGAQTIHSTIYRPAGSGKSTALLELDLRISQFYADVGDRYPDKLTREETSLLAVMSRSRRELREKNQPKYSLWEDSPLARSDVEGMVLDEVSMVDARLGKDVESFGKKLLVLGDPAQLPPVGGGGYFTDMAPRTMLTEIHRHAADSGVLRLATMIRQSASTSATLGSFGDSADGSCQVVFRADIDREYVNELTMTHDQILVGRNVTRRKANDRHREITGHGSVGPSPGERLVCLRNDRGLGLFNGSQWRVESADSDVESRMVSLSLTSDDDERRTVDCDSWLHHMIGRSQELEAMDSSDRRDTAEFDWGYALTVHKAQGSQWDSVLLMDESSSFSKDRRRWLYTGITRAARKLTVIA
jgi:exodeoxyribonuclease-5